MSQHSIDEYHTHYKVLHKGFIYLLTYLLTTQGILNMGCAPLYEAFPVAVWSKVTEIQPSAVQTAVAWYNVVLYGLLRLTEIRFYVPLDTK